jgi:hypothetical protein
MSFKENKIEPIEKVKFVHHHLSLCIDLLQEDQIEYPEIRIILDVLESTRINLEKYIQEKEV